MLPNPGFPADLVTLLKKPLMENFIFFVECSLFKTNWPFTQSVIETAQIMNFNMKDFFSKWNADLVTFLMKKSLMENFIFCAVEKGLSEL